MLSTIKGCFRLLRDAFDDLGCFRVLRDAFDYLGYSRLSRKLTTENGKNFAPATDAKFYCTESLR